MTGPSSCFNQSISPSITPKNWFPCTSLCTPWNRDLTIVSLTPGVGHQDFDMLLCSRIRHMLFCTTLIQSLNPQTKQLLVENRDWLLSKVLRPHIYFNRYVNCWIDQRQIITNKWFNTCLIPNGFQKCIEPQWMILNLLILTPFPQCTKKRISNCAVSGLIPSLLIRSKPYSTKEFLLMSTGFFGPWMGNHFMKCRTLGNPLTGGFCN